MMLPAGVAQSIDKNKIEIGEGWLYSFLPIWTVTYSQELTQPVSVSAVGLSDLRFLGDKTTIVIREEPDSLSPVIWSGIAKLVDDPSSGGGGPVDLPRHNDLPGRIASDAHPIAAITGLADELASLTAQATREIEAFPRGDIVWQTDPGGLWDSDLCFVQIFPTIGRRALAWIDFEFGAAGSGVDGRFALWGGVDSTGAWTLLAQDDLPNSVHGLARYEFVPTLDISPYNLIAFAQDPGAAGVMQPVRQASTYFSPNPPSGPPAAYAYLGAHTHGDPFTTLPVIPANDAIYLMQKWSSIGVR